MLSRILRYLAVVFMYALMAQPALAHHMMDGDLPDTLLAGLLSGLGHPVIGIDHFVFTLGVGIAAFAANRLVQLPLLFVGFTLLGAMLHVAAVTLPGAEWVILASIIGAGALLIFKPDVRLAIWAAMFAVAGLFHGYAYGESIVGSEPTPLFAYFVGFAAIQYLIALAAGLTCKIISLPKLQSARTGGGLLVGAGLVLASAFIPVSV